MVHQVKDELGWKCKKEVNFHRARIFSGIVSNTHSKTAHSASSFHSLTNSTQDALMTINTEAEQRKAEAIQSLLISHSAFR